MARSLRPITPHLPWVRSISGRSALISALVMLVAFGAAAAASLSVLYYALLSGVDDAAVNRVRDITRALGTDTPVALNPQLLATGARIVAVQILDDAGRLVTKSNSAPTQPMLALSTVGNGPVTGQAAVGMTDIRVSGHRLDTPTGRYVVLVGADTEDVEGTIRAVALGLAAAGPLVIGTAALATYFLVRRSLQSVEAIRAQVSAISVSDLAERVPVPTQRDEIFTLATTMNQMLSRLQSGHAAQRRFVADASHELRSPLSTVISTVEMVVEHPELLTVRLAEEILLPETRRMQTLVDDLLLLARADERGLSFRLADADLDDLASNAVARLRRETTLNVQARLAPSRIVGDATALARMLRNLCDNAARYAASLVEIEIRTRGTFAVVTVTDDGPGIQAQDRVRVFERFVRLDDNRSRALGGSGLGLAIVHEIVSAHAGQVRIDDRPGGGTVVSVQLPLAEIGTEPASSSR